MEKLNEKDYRLITEIRVLATALLSDNKDVRSRIFNFAYFTTEVGKEICKKMSGVYEKSPEADYSVYISPLDKDEQEVLVMAMKTAVDSTVNENLIDGVLDSLKYTAIDSVMKHKIAELSIAGDYTAEDLRRIADETEQADSEDIANSLKTYLDGYGTPTEHIPTGYPILDRMLNGGQSCDCRQVTSGCMEKEGHSRMINPRLNKFTGGFVRGTLISLGARPSVGKTTFAINIAANNPDKKIVFFSLEMSVRMIYDKIVASEGNIDYSHAVNHSVNFETVKCILEKYPNLIVIDNVSRAEDMAEIIRTIKPDLVFVDYVQIVQTVREFEAVRQRIDYISQIFKRTAKYVNCCIIALSQLTRGAKEEPTMSALKESGGLEQDSDYIILLKRPYVLDKSNKDILPSDTTLKLDKNKFGDSGEIKYYFDGAHQRFSENEAEPTAHMKANSEEDYDDGDLPF